VACVTDDGSESASANPEPPFSAGDSVAALYSPEIFYGGTVRKLESGDAAIS